MITSSQFYHTWVEIVSARKESLLTIWRKAKLFTPYIKEAEDSVLREVARKLKLQCYPNDYYSIDAIFYDENDLVPERPNGSTWFREIRVAIEHENYFYSGLYKEVSHLLLINCDLKVLITYYPQGDYEDELCYLHKVIKETRHSSELAEKQNFLMIIGAENGFIWDGYVYAEDEWKLIGTTEAQAPNISLLQ